MATLTEKYTPRLQAIRKRAAELPESNHIVSLDNHEKRSKAGHVFLADAMTAAACEYEMTHRLCTKEEVEDFKHKDEEMRQSIIDRETARRANFNINVTVPSQGEGPKRVK